MPSTADASNKAITTMGKLLSWGIMQPEELVGKLSIAYLADCVNILHNFGELDFSVQLPIFFYIKFDFKNSTFLNFVFNKRKLFYFYKNL